MFRLFLTICLAIVTSTASAQSSIDMRVFEGKYVFTGTSPFCDAEEHTPKGSYDCNITADTDGHLRLTGFVGNVDSEEKPYFQGVYDAERKRITFSCGPEGDGENIYDESGRRYFVYDFSLNVYIDDTDSIAFSHRGPFWFYTMKDDKWVHASYDGMCFTKDMVNTAWNGKTIEPITTRMLEDLLEYTIRFEKAASAAIQKDEFAAVIFNEDGFPYALALLNDSISNGGAADARRAKVTVRFHTLAEFDSSVIDATSNLFEYRGYPTPGQVAVVFRKGSFFVDGELLEEELIHFVDIEKSKEK